MAAGVIVPVVVLLAIFSVTGVVLPQPTIVSYLVLCSVAGALLVVAAGFLYSYLSNYFKVVTRQEFMESLKALSSRINVAFNVTQTLTVSFKELSTNSELNSEAVMEALSETKMEVDVMRSRVSGVESKIRTIHNVIDSLKVKIDGLEQKSDLTNRGIALLCRRLGDPMDATLITLLFELGRSGGPNILDGAETQRVLHIAQHVPAFRSFVMRRQ